MVTINFTLLVLLGMFLTFLWAMHRFIFSPLLALMDAREEQIEDDKRTAIAAGSEASALEDQYSDKIAQMHREASLNISRAHRQAQEEHSARVVAFKNKAEQEIMALGESLAAEIALQEDQFGPLSQEIQHAMTAKLELK